MNGSKNAVSLHTNFKLFIPVKKNSGGMILVLCLLNVKPILHHIHLPLRVRLLNLEGIRQKVTRRHKGRSVPIALGIFSALFLVSSTIFLFQHS